MTRLDWIVLGVVVFTALLGLWQGFVLGALSAAGVIVGAVAGARLAPLLLPEGSRSPYTPLVALLGAAGMAVLLEVVGSSLGLALRERLRRSGVRTLDSVGGLAFGALAGLALIWVLAAVALQLPGLPDIRREVQRSAVVRELNDAVPPRRMLRALARVDLFPSIAGPAPAVDPPDGAVLRRPAIRRAADSVVRVVGTACGLGVAGSGWVAGRETVVTNAHVVAGQDDTSVDGRSAHAVAFDSRNDVAVLRVPGLGAEPLPAADADSGAPVAILGYPKNGPLRAVPGRVGRTSGVLSEDAYGQGPVARRVTVFRGEVRRGNSGGPLVDAAGRVVGTVFAARTGGEAGYAVPTDVVQEVLEEGGAPVSTGECGG